MRALDMSGWLLMLLMLFLSAHAAAWMESESTLGAAAVDFHAYEDAFEVRFERTPAGLFAFEIGVHGSLQELVQAAGLVNCRELSNAFAEAGWHNEYLRGLAAANESSLCAALDAGAAQAGAARVLTGRDGAALVRVQTPLALLLFNEDELFAEWAERRTRSAMHANSTDVLRVALRASYVTQIGSGLFALRRETLLLEVQRPQLRLLTIGLQNSCAAAGLSAPALGSVQLEEMAGRLRCVWRCRGDLIRQPFNSMPPTLAQVNALTSEYACVRPPTGWTATVFGATLETEMMQDGTEYSQALFDAIDRLAVTVRKGMQTGDTLQERLVVMSVVGSVYLPVPFAKWAEQMLAASCYAGTETRCDAAAIANPRYVYGRRRLRNLLEARVLHYVRIEGLVLAGRPAATREELLAEVQQLRSALATAVAEDMQQLLITGVLDVDVQTVIVPLGKATPESVDVDGALEPAMIPALVAGGAVAAGALVCVMWVAYAR